MKRTTVLRAIRWRTLVLLSVLLAGLGMIVSATHGEPHALITYWDLVAGPGASGFNGFDPHEQLADVPGRTNQLADSTPTMVTAMENACGGMCSIMFWNPDTNEFKTVCVTGGLDFAVDVNRSSTLGAGTPGSFGGGDAWSAVFANSGFSPYVVYRGNDTIFSRFDTGTFDATGIRVNPANGRVYFGSFGGRIVELDPATNTVRKWTIGNRPYFLAINGSGLVYATAVAGGGFPDQIVRLNPTTGAVTRWNVPGTMNFTTIVGEGNPNYISIDTTNSNRLWFSETESNQVARLDTSANTITEWTKAGIEHPNAINNAGFQAFFTEAGGPLDPTGRVTILQVNESTIGVTTPAPPATTTVTPVSSTALRFDQAPIQVNRATITPSTFDSPSEDPSGFYRFPIPLGTLRPTGMTGVWRPRTISGSMEGTHHVFTFESDIISSGLTLTPASATNPIATPHTVTATVTVNGEPQAGVVVTFTVAGSGGSVPTPPGGTCVTGADGSCTFTYTSPSPGHDVITATATVEGRTLTATATKDWTVERVREGRLTGGGTTTGVFDAGVPLPVTVDAHQGLTLQCDETRLPNNLQVSWDGGNHFHLDTLDTATCFDDPSKMPNPPPAGFDSYIGTGTGSCNGTPGATAEWYFTDEGESGTEDDVRSLKITCTDGSTLTVSGMDNLQGNFQAHGR